MNNFRPGQRWVSNTEPELGLGLIDEVQDNRVSIVFPASTVKRLYARQNAPLTRVVFAEKEQITDIKQRQMTVQKVEQEAGVLCYICRDEAGREIKLPELQLNPHLQFNKPQERLFAGHTDPGSWFELRCQTWKHLQRIQQSPVKGLSGARISLLAHQIYIAHEAASRFAPRVMLADEVGLGKTIEAALILQQRLLNGLSRRVLIMVPESLQHQWLVEMIRRFNLRFSLFDETRCLTLQDQNPFLTEQLVLCSQEFLFKRLQRQTQILAGEWDLVIIDEAHHVDWDPVSPSPEYRFVAQLAEQVPGLILLTATPEQMGTASHFARLRLLDPERFFSLEKFIDEQQQFALVAQAANLLLQNQTLDETQLRPLLSRLANDPVTALLRSLNKDSNAQNQREEIIHKLLDYHGTGRILFRNSRHTIKGFPERCVHAYPLKTMLHAKSDPGPEPLPEDVRFIWLLDILNALAEQKALLICKESALAVALSKAVHRKTGCLIPVFHEAMSIIERDRAAAWFADEEKSVPLLICSEIGSEGRNFQFVQHLILYDLPENPDLLQQRIGRLDRIGQKPLIHIHVPYIENTAGALLFRWYDEGMNALRRNCTAAQRLYALQKNELQLLMQQSDPAKIDDFIRRTVALCGKIEQELHDGRDQLLELNSCRMPVAKKLLAELQAFGQGEALWKYVEQIADCYGVETEFHSRDTYILQPGQQMRMAHFPELPEEGLTVTINRTLALAHEDWQFLTWEHPLLVASMDLVLSSDTGNAAVSLLRHPSLAAGHYLLESLFVIECSAAAELQINRFLPPTPLRILLDQKAEDLSAKIAQDSFLASHEKLEAAALNEFLNSEKAQLKQLLALAEAKARQQMQKIMLQSRQNMLESLSGEIKRLIALKKINPTIKQADIDSLKEHTRLAYTCIQAAQLRLDAIRFIILT